MDRRQQDFMNRRERDFAKFLWAWCEKNLGSFADRIDPSDERQVHARHAERLKESAEAAGFRTEITMLRSTSEGGLVEYVKRRYEAAEFRRKHVRI